MAVEIKLPSLGDGVESGDVLELLVAEGDEIEKDQGIVEMETDKATVIVPSDYAGKVTKIMVGEGDSLSVGAVIMTIDEVESGGSAPEAPAPEQKSEPEPAPKKEPEQKQESKAEPAPSPKEPVAETPPPAKPTPAPATPAPAPAASVGSMTDVAAGPAVRKFAREVGIDLTRVSGTGQKGRITRDDVLAAIRSNGGGSSSAAAPVPAGGQSDGFGPVNIEKMPKIRQAIARKMHESWSSVPRVTNFDDADVTKLEAMRQNSKEDYAAQGIKLTTMPFLIKAIAMSLKHHPVINASVDMEAGQIIYKNYVNIGIAVDTDRGLVVPSLRNADQMSIGDIAAS